MAEAHWNFVEHIILHQLELTHYLYVEAMVHGIKHEKTRREETNK